MARDFSERERASVERDRRIRKTINQGKSYPYGDRDINPQKKESAYDYYKWMGRAKSVSIHAGAYLGNLEREERVLGVISYPPDHPRHTHVQEGRYYPDGVPMPKEAYANPAGRVSPLMDELKSAASKALAERPRANNLEAICAGCGKTVPAGGGRLVRRSDGYVTMHNDES